LVRDVRDGRADRSVGETYRAVQPRLPGVIAAGVVAAIAIGIGFLLLIVPGLFLLTIWSMLVPVIVLEGLSAGDSFTRSREIVRGNGWSVFGLIVVTFLLVGGVGGAGNRVREPAAELRPRDPGSLERDDGHTEDPSLPRLVEHELAVRAGKRRRFGQRTVDFREAHASAGSAARAVPIIE